MIDFKKKIVDLLPEGIDETQIESPKNKEMGDWAFPCFVLAKTMRKSPKMIAEELADQIQKDMPDFLEKVEAVAGFLNFTIDSKLMIKDTIQEVVFKGESFGKSDVGQQQRIIVEYSATNIAKPFHIGHLRSTAIGESLARMYRFLGYDVFTINHLGDYGTQFGKLIVAYQKWGEPKVIEQNPIPELLKLYVRFHQEAEKNPELDQEARDWFTKLEHNDNEAYELWSFFREVSLDEFKRVYKKLDTHFDSWNGEAFYSDKMPAVLEALREKKLLTLSEGAQIVDLSSFDLLPALVTKRDGSTLYLTRDLATAIYRETTYHPVKCLYVVGMTQSLHFKQVFAVLKRMGHDWVEHFHHIPFGQISLEEGSLSTRSGNVVFLDDVLEQSYEKTLAVMKEKNPDLPNMTAVARDIGYGAVIFQELYTSREKDYLFSFEKFGSFTGETGPYVQYTHARCCSILNRYRKDHEMPYAEDIDISLLTDSETVIFLKSVRRYTDVVELAVRENSPHIVARYVIELAQNFNRFYHENSILNADRETQKARVLVVDIARTVLKSAMSLICLKAPEEM